jgi:hypothetical protein
MVKPHCLLHVRHSETAKEAWEALQTAFEDRSKQQMQTFRKTCEPKLEQFNTIQAYVTDDVQPPKTERYRQGS